MNGDPLDWGFDDTLSEVSTESAPSSLETLSATDVSTLLDEAWEKMQQKRTSTRLDGLTTMTRLIRHRVDVIWITLCQMFFQPTGGCDV